MVMRKARALAAPVIHLLVVMIGTASLVFGALRLTGLATKNKGVYTRYADDLTFSFPDAAIDVGRFRWWVDQVCHQEGFFVNQKKFHVIRASQRQLVTDLLDRAFGGSPAQLAMQALSTKKASAEELAELRKLLDTLEGEETP